MKRTRKDFINALVSAGIQSVDAKKFIDEFIKIIQGSLSRGEDVRIKNFGKFAFIKRNASEFINPKTKKLIKIPEHFKIRFVPSENLKKLKNKK